MSDSLGKENNKNRIIIMNEEQLNQWVIKARYKWQKRLDQEKAKRKYNDPEYSEKNEGLCLGWCKALSALKGLLNKKEDN